jgi:predicted PhzF superfamily epimerase YddE/YHI9
MNRLGVVTVALMHAHDRKNFSARNAFASGGVLEDPATGAAAAAFAGYLRDLGWPHGGDIEIIQGEDMGMRSRIRADISDIAGSSIRISGGARLLGQ